MKKLLCMLLAVAMILGLSVTAFAADYKIAILTGTTSQGEEEFRAAQKELAKDPTGIITDTYPDSFMAEQETTVAKLLAFAADPDVKAIIMCQGVPGAKAAFDKIKEMGRDDILTIVGVPQEVPEVIAAASDISIMANEVGQGDLIMEKCAEWGVEVFIHYSFPRHMAMELIVARHELLKANADALGIEMVDVTAPDPTAEAGPSASQQFILEDVPAQMEKYAGKKVAFFTTNCGMQEPLQTAILTQPNAFYPSPCCPSPYHAFPAVLSLELEAGADNVAALKAIAEKLAQYEAVERYSTWAAPVAMTIIEAGVAYAHQYIAGQTNGRNDKAALATILEDLIPGMRMGEYTDANGKTLDNFYTILLAPVNFADYAE